MICQVPILTMCKIDRAKILTPNFTGYGVTLCKLALFLHFCALHGHICYASEWQKHHSSVFYSEEVVVLPDMAMEGIKTKKRPVWNQILRGLRNSVRWVIFPTSRAFMATKYKLSICPERSFKALNPIIT